MDVKDLRIDPIDRERNEFNINYGEQKTSSSDRNYLGSNTIPKMDTQPSRPCAIIGPDRVVSQPSENLDFKKSCNEWSYSDNVACPPFDDYEKLPKQYPSRNISPRLTYQENMQRIMMPPCHDAPNNLAMSTNFANENNVTRNINHVVDSKFSDVPYNVTRGPLEQRTFGSSEVSNQHSAMPMIPPRGWGPTNATPGQSFRPQFSPSEMYRYPEYSNRAYPVSIGNTHMISEESSHMYPDSYYRPGNMRYEPYPSSKDRLSHVRYVSNYSVSYNPRNYHHTYMPYNQIPLKYLGPHVNDTSIGGVQRPINSTQLFNSPYPTHGFPTNHTSAANKSYFSGKLPYSNESTVKLKQNVKTCDNNPAKMYTEYDLSQIKSYPHSDNAYMNQIPPSSNMKGSVISNFPTFNVQSSPHRSQYQRNISELSNCKSANYLPQYKIMTNDNTNHLTRLHSQFAPNVPYLNANTNLDLINSHTISQESYTYLEDRSSFNKKNNELSRVLNPGYYKKFDNTYVSHKTSALPLKSEINPNKIRLRDKKNLDVRQFLQMWNEGDEEILDNNIVNTSVITVNSNENVSTNIPNSTDQLYVLDSINVPTEDLSKYEHIQKVSKLPDNIKGYNGVELLNQFEKVLCNTDTKYKYFKPDVSANYNKIFLTDNNSSERPLSPLDVEAKISQSVIHKEVGCNFEIKPCSPKSLNVDIVTPAQTLSVERQIEKVVNPNAVQALSHQLLRNKNKEPCEAIKAHTQHLAIQRVEPSSCKLTENDTRTSTIDLKTSYNLQEFDSNSGVCLASLPRLDNDIEFNFPEVNQQFLDANKSDLIVNKSRNPIMEYQSIKETNKKIDEQSQSSSFNDPKVIPKENSNTVSSDILNSIPLDHDNTKDSLKLSKFRKIKNNVSKVMEGTLMKPHHTCNVIVKSTSAAKDPLLEKKVNVNLDKFINNISSPMNLTASKSHIQNIDDFDVIQCNVNVEENEKNNSNKSSHLALHSEDNQIKDSLIEITKNTSSFQNADSFEVIQCDVNVEENEKNNSNKTRSLALHAKDNQIRDSLNEITENASSFQNADNFNVVQCDMNIEENKKTYLNKTSNLALCSEDNQIKDSSNEITENASSLENQTEHKQYSDLSYTLQSSHIALHSEDNQIKDTLNEITENTSSSQNADSFEVIQCDVNVEENEKNNSNKTSTLVALHSKDNLIKNSLNEITENASSFQNANSFHVIQCDVNMEENKNIYSNKTRNLALRSEDTQIKDSSSEIPENLSSLENQTEHKHDSDLNCDLQSSHIALHSEDNQIKDSLNEVTENTSSSQNADSIEVIQSNVNVEENEKNNSSKTSTLTLHSKDNRIKDSLNEITENASSFQNADNFFGIQRHVNMEENKNLYSNKTSNLALLSEDNQIKDFSNEITENTSSLENQTEHKQDSVLNYNLQTSHIALLSEDNQIKDSLNKITENTSSLEIASNQTEHKQESDLNYNVQCADKYIVDSLNSIEISKNKVAISESIGTINTLELNLKKKNTLINRKSILLNENVINTVDSTVQMSIFSDKTCSKNDVSGYYINNNNIQQISKGVHLNTHNQLNFSIEKYTTESTQAVEMNVDNMHILNDSITNVSDSHESAHKTSLSNNPLDNVEKNTSNANTQDVNNFTSIDGNVLNLSHELTHNTKSVVVEKLIEDQIVDNSKIKLKSQILNLDKSAHSLDSLNNISVIYAHDKEVTFIEDEQQLDEKQGVDGLVDISRGSEPMKVNSSVTTNQELINQCSEEVNMKSYEENVVNTSSSSPLNKNQECSPNHDIVPLLELNSKSLVKGLEKDLVCMTQSEHNKYFFGSGNKKQSETNLTSQSDKICNARESAILLPNFNTKEMLLKADVDKCVGMSNNIKIPMQKTKNKFIFTKELFSPRMQNLFVNSEGLAKIQSETTLKSDDKEVIFKGGNMTVQSQSIPFAKILPMQCTATMEIKSNEIKNLNKATINKASVDNLSNILESDDCNKSVILNAGFNCTPKNSPENTANMTFTLNDRNIKSISNNSFNKSKDFVGETTHINLESNDYKTLHNDSVYVNNTTNEIMKSDALENCANYESSQYLGKKCFKGITKKFLNLEKEIPCVDNSECYVDNLANTSVKLTIQNDHETKNLFENPEYVSNDSVEKIASRIAKMKHKSNIMFENSTISSEVSKETTLKIPVTVSDSKEILSYENYEGLSESSINKYQNATVESNDHKPVMFYENIERLKENSVDEMTSSSLKIYDHHALLTYNDSKFTSKNVVEEIPTTAVKLNVNKVIVSYENLSEEAIEATTKTIQNSNDYITPVSCEIESKDDHADLAPEGLVKETKSVILTPDANKVFVNYEKTENLSKYGFIKETSEMNFKDSSNLFLTYQPSKCLSNDSTKEKSDITLNSSDHGIVSYESIECLSKKFVKGTSNISLKLNDHKVTELSKNCEYERSENVLRNCVQKVSDDSQMQIIYESSKYLLTSSMKERNNNEKLLDNSVINEPSKTIYNTEGDFFKNAEGRSFCCSGNIRKMHKKDIGNFDTCYKCDNSCKKSSTLKSRLKRRNVRSLSDSEILEYDLSYVRNINSNRESYHWPKKIKKNVTEDYIGMDNLNETASSCRRNSIASILNDENVSVCILIDSDCLIGDELLDNSEKEESYFYQQNDIFRANDSSATTTVNFPIENDLSEEHIIQKDDIHDCEDNENCTSKDYGDFWVDDVGCIETVVGDEINESNENSQSTYEIGGVGKSFDSLEDICSENFDSTKIKAIYGPNIPKNDMNLIESLYKTPQMNVNEKLKMVSTSPAQSEEYIPNKPCNIQVQKVFNNICNFSTTVPTLNEKIDCVKESFNINDINIYRDTTSMLKNDTIKDIELNKEILYLPTSVDKCLTLADNNPEKFTFSTNQKESSIQTHAQISTIQTAEKLLSELNNSVNTSASSFPEVSSTTSEETSSILLKICNFDSSRMSYIKTGDLEFKKGLRCKLTEISHYGKSDGSSVDFKPLVTKAAQKYIPPMKIPNMLQVKLPLPECTLQRLKQLKMSKDRPKSKVPLGVCTKVKPNFEDVLKSIDEMQYKLHRSKCKVKQAIPKVIIKKSENGSHYASTSRQMHNPDLTGRKWQPWVFLEKNKFIDKMAIKRKTKAIYCHKRNAYVITDQFQNNSKIEQCAGSSTKLVISRPKDKLKMPLKYTVRLKSS